MGETTHMSHQEHSKEGGGSGAAQQEQHLQEEWPEELAEARSEAQRKCDEADRAMREAAQKAHEAAAQKSHWAGIARSLEHRQRVIAPEPAAAKAPTAARRKPTQRVTDQVRALAAEAVIDKNLTWEEAEERYEISHATLGRIVGEERRARAGEVPRLQPAKKRGRHVLFTPASLVWLCTEIERDAGVALKTLCAGLVREFDIDVSRGTVSKAIKSLHITWKNVLPIPESWNTPKTIAERTKYAERATMEYASDREFIYIDEQGYDLHLSRKTKGHALSGQPAVLAMKPKGHRVSLIAALSKQGIIHTKLVESLGPQKRGTNADDFRLFIHDLRAKISRGALLLFDGAKIHVAEELKELWPVLETEFAIEHVVLPANSPPSTPLSAHSIRSRRKFRYQTHWMQFVHLTFL